MQWLIRLSLGHILKRPERRPRQKTIPKGTRPLRLCPPKRTAVGLGGSNFFGSVGTFSDFHTPVLLALIWISSASSALMRTRNQVAAPPFRSLIAFWIAHLAVSNASVASTRWLTLGPKRGSR